MEQRKHSERSIRIRGAFLFSEYKILVIFVVGYKIYLAQGKELRNQKQVAVKAKNVALVPLA